MKIPAWKVAITLCLCVWLLQGCSEPEQETTPFLGSKEEKTLLIGLIPEQNIFKQLERYEPLGEYLSKKIGVKVKLIVLTRYGNIVDNFVSTDLDGAFFGSFTYAQAHALMRIEALARPETDDGISTYNGVIITRKDSGIQTVSDMQGKRFAFVDKETTAGYLFPLLYFKKHGVESFEDYFKEYYFAGTHEDVIYDVLQKKADIGAAKNTIYEKLAELDDTIKENLIVLEMSQEVPENCLGVRSDMESSLKTGIKEALFNMHKDPEGEKILKEFGANKFIETKNSDYEVVYQYAKEINLDLGNYNYSREHKNVRSEK